MLLICAVRWLVYPDRQYYLPTWICYFITSMWQHGVFHSPLLWTNAHMFDSGQRRRRHNSHSSSKHTGSLICLSCMALNIMSSYSVASWLMFWMSTAVMWHTLLDKPSFSAVDPWEVEPHTPTECNDHSLCLYIRYAVRVKRSIISHFV